MATMIQRLAAKGAAADDDKPADGKPAEGDPAPADGKPAEGDPAPADGKPAEGDPAPAEGAPAEGDPAPADGKPGEDKDDDDDGKPAADADAGWRAAVERRIAALEGDIGKLRAALRDPAMAAAALPTAQAGGSAAEAPGARERLERQYSALRTARERAAFRAAHAKELGLRAAR